MLIIAEVATLHQEDNTQSYTAPGTEEDATPTPATDSPLAVTQKVKAKGRAKARETKLRLWTTPAPSPKGITTQEHAVETGRAAVSGEEGADH